jgi:ubiquinone/menaquinone biosynthesis C-methylase UbiE
MASLLSLAGTLHEAVVFGRRTRVLSERILPLFPANARVLDVGAGDGTIASLWQKMRPDLCVEGIDVLVRPDTKVPVRAFDGRTIPYSDNSTDVVVFVDVLHHTDDPLSLLREATRVARKKIVIKDHFSENFLDHTTLRLMDWVGNAAHGVALPYNYLSRTAWQRLFAKAALHQTGVELRLPLYPFPASLIFGRGLHFIADLQPA